MRRIVLMLATSLTLAAPLAAQDPVERTADIGVMFGVAHTFGGLTSIGVPGGGKLYASFPLASRAAIRLEGRLASISEGRESVSTYGIGVYLPILLTSIASGPYVLGGVSAVRVDDGDTDVGIGRLWRFGSGLVFRAEGMYHRHPSNAASSVQLLLGVGAAVG